MTDNQVQLICERCGQPCDNLLAWRCETCGGPLWFARLPPFDPEAIRQHEWSLWRYAALLPVIRRFSLGEGMTPLIPAATNMPFLAKLEFVSPTGSFKDRGVAVMLNHLLGQDVAAVVEDSSGNAGAAVAAYASNIGMAASIYVPAQAPPNKISQIARYGAAVVKVSGPRAAATRACEEAARQNAYATHAWNPFYLAGQMTSAWEIWEQMGQRAPDAVVCPVGQGGLFLGLARGFQTLHEAGLIDRLPRLFAAQTSAYDPIVRAWEAGSDDPLEPTGGHTLADGIKIAAPVRGREILAVIRGSEGGAFRVDEEAVKDTQSTLAGHGLYVEPTSAVPVAALHAVQARLEGHAEIVVPLTGSGLKAG